MEVLAAVAGKIAELTVTPIGRQVGYVLFYKDNFKELKDKIEELKTRKIRTEHDVEAERRSGREIEDDVKSWQKRVEKTLEEGEKLCEGEPHASVQCWKCSFPNLISRHQLGRKAKKMAFLIAELEQKKFDGGVGRVPASSLANLIFATRGSEKLESRNSSKEKVVSCLSDPKISKVGIYGLGGVGKTTLAKEVAKYVNNHKVFDVVVMVTISQTWDVNRVQDEIAYQLGFHLDEKIPIGRADRLCARIKMEKSILIILDDLWDEINLDKLGIPCEQDLKGCKLLLTSRSLDILKKNETQRNFLLQTLDKAESWSLFEDMVGDDAIKDADLKQIAIQVVERCVGLPVMIVSIAKSLKYNKNIHYWKDVLNNLKGVDTGDVYGTVFSAFEFTYERLGDEMKKVFLLCGVYGPSLRVNDLLKYVIGLGVLKRIDTVEDARNRLYSIIDGLKASCLLLDNDASETNAINMHDLVREVAVSIAHKNEHAYSLKINDDRRQGWPSKDFLKKCTQIILKPCFFQELPQKLDCPNLKFFLLNSFSSTLKIPDSFFEGMGSLEVLDLTGYLIISSVPKSLVSLTKLKTLCLDHCALQDMAGIGDLIDLEILSFAYSSIEEFPSEIGQLTHLRMLNLSYSRIKILPPNILSKLTKIEELYMENASITWEEESSTKQNKNASLAELGCFKNLTALEIQIREAWMLSRDMMFDKLERYKVVIGATWGWQRPKDERTSRVLKLKLDPSTHLEDGIKALIGRAKDLYLDEVNGISDVLFDLNGEGFPLLKYLQIQNNGQVQHIINTMGRNETQVLFPKLETLILDNLTNLVKICHGPLPVDSFHKLTVIRIRSCDKLEYLCSAVMAKALSLLVELQVFKCSSMKSIVNIENEDCGIIADDKIEFHSLRSLSLCQLPLIHVFKVSFPGLETLVLSSINVEKIWSDDHLSAANCIHNLANLTVEDCRGLKHLFSSSVIGSLSNLKNLEISNCEMMEEIIATEGRNSTASQYQVRFSKLETMVVKDMKSLNKVWHFQFDKLKTLEVSNCGKLANIFPYDMQRTFRSLETLEVSDCGSLKEIFEIHIEDQTATQVSQLKKLHLLDLPKLKKIWSRDPQENLRFHNLQLVFVRNCENLEYLFPFSIAKHAIQLEDITIKNVGSMKHIVSHKEGVLDSPVKFEFNRLKSLELWNLSELEGFFAGNHSVLCPLLRELDIRQCGKLKLFKSQSTSGKERVLIDSTSGNLKSLVVHKCDFLSNELLPLNLVQALPNLEELQVSECDSLEAVFDLTNMDPKEVFVKETAIQLKSITLSSLPKLKHIWKQNLQETAEGHIHHHGPASSIQQVRLPNLETITIEGMPELKTIWHPFFTSNSFDKLQMMKVSKCEKLDNMFPSYMQRASTSLETLIVSDCNSVKVIFEFSSEMGSAEKPTRLKKLTILRLLKLKQIWSRRAHANLRFHNLNHVCVEECENLEYLFPFSIAMHEIQLKDITVKYARSMKQIVWDEGVLDSAVKFEFNHLSSLALWWLFELEGFFAGNHSVVCPLLRELDVRRCGKLKLFKTQSTSGGERVLDSKLQISMQQQPLFTLEEVICNLEKLALNSEDASMILSGQFSREHFRELKYLFLVNFEDDHATFPYWFLQNITTLYWLLVEWSSFKEIFHEEIHVDIETRIKKLTLYELHDLQHICKEGFQIDQILEALEYLDVRECSKLKHLVPSSVTFSYLTYLKVGNCNGLIHLITSSTARSLVKLRTMKIRNCNSLEQVVKEEREGSEDEIAFRSLNILELECLPMIKMFCSCNCFLNLPLLNKVVVKQCPRMNIFSRSDTSTPKLQKILSKEEDENKHWEGDLNRTINKMFMDMVAYSGFDYLELSKYPELKELWYSPVGHKIFYNLKHLVVHKCEFLENTIFTSNLLQLLYTLEELEVTECDSLEAVFDIEVLDDKETHPKEASRLKRLTLSGLSKLKYIWNKDLPKALSLENLQVVHVAECQNLKYVFSPSLCQDLRQLEELNIESCGLKKIVANEEGLDEFNFYFPHLRIFRLIDLRQLNDFYPRRYTLECPSLNVLNVGKCEALQIFAFGHLDFQQLRGVSVDLPIQQALFHIEKVPGSLEELSLNGRDAMRILNGNYEKKLFQRIERLRLQYFQETPMKFLNQLLERFPGATALQARWSAFDTLFPTAEISHFSIKTPTQKKNLGLYQLEQLEHIWNDDDSTSHPLIQNLEGLFIHECCRLIRLAPPFASFKNLTSLEVEHCNGLMYLMTSFTAKSLIHLTSLIVSNCGMLEEVVIMDKRESEEEMTFESLKELKLTGLSVFKSFCSAKHTFIFPSLVTVEVTGCHKMQNFSSGISVTPFLKLVQVENGKKRWKGDINTTIKHLFIEKTNEHLNMDTTGASSNEKQVGQSKPNQIADTAKQETHKLPSQSYDREHNEKEMVENIERTLVEAPKIALNPTGVYDAEVNETIEKPLNQTAQEAQRPTAVHDKEGSPESKTPARENMLNQPKTIVTSEEKEITGNQEIHDAKDKPLIQTDQGGEKLAKAQNTEESCDSYIETQKIYDAMKKPSIPTAQRVPDSTMIPEAAIDPSPLQAPEHMISSIHKSNIYRNYMGMIDIPDKNMPYLEAGVNRHPQVLDWLNTKRRRVLASSSFSLFAEVTHILRTTRRSHLTEDDRNYIRECCSMLEVVGFDASWLNYVYKCIEGCGDGEDIKRKVEETKDQASTLRAQLESMKKELASVEESLALLLDKASKIDDFIES